MLLVLPAALVAAACTAGSPAATARQPRSAPPVRLELDVPPGATVQPPAPHTDGVVDVRLLWAQCGIETVVGTHAEYTPQRPLCTVRLRVTNRTGGFATFDAVRSALLEPDGSAVGVARDVAGIQRQPEAVELGGHDVAELALWFEPPLGPRPVSLRLPASSDADGRRHLQPPVPLVWARG